MSSFPRRTVAYHLGGLDRQSLAAFVADLWTARGFETDRDGTRVIATHEGESVTLLIASESPHVGSRATSDSDVPAAVDVVVTTDSSTTVNECRLVDTDDLAEMLGYAVDRETAVGLCDRHLGAPPADLPEPPLTRVRRRVSAFGTDATTAVVLGALALVVATTIAVGFNPFAGTGDQSPASLPGEQERVTPAESSVIRDGVTIADGELVRGSLREAEDRERARGLPPGVTSNGISDLDALVRTHERRLENRSYTVWVDRYWPRHLTPDGTRLQRDIDVAVEGDRYLVEVTEVVGTATNGSEKRTPLGALYHDGTFSYAAPWNETKGSYGEVFRLDPRQGVQMTPARIRSRVVGTYLSTPRTDVTGTVSRNGRTLYRVVGTGTPQRGELGEVHNYSVIALVDARGFVRQVTVEFEESAPEGRYQVRRTISYSRVGTTSVSRPAWFERPVDTDST